MSIPEYEHFSFFQNVIFLRAPESTDMVEETLAEIINLMGEPEIVKPLNREECSCEIAFSVERHQGIIPSIAKPLRLILTFSQVGGPAATKRGDIVNE